MASVLPIAQLAKKRVSVEEIISAWAATLTPANAPDPKLRGPLAWVRAEKAVELVAVLKKEGY